MQYSSSNAATFRTVTDILEKGKISYSQTLDGDPTESVDPPNCLHLRDSSTDETKAVPLEATPRKSKSTFPTFPPNVSSELKIHDILTAQIKNSKRKQKSLNR